MKVQMFARAAVPALALLGVGCASQSGFNIDVRNNTNDPAVLTLRAQQKNEEPKVVDTFHVGSGGTTRHFTRLEARSKVTLEAQVEGETSRPPATTQITLGETRVDIVPQTEKQANDPKAPRVRIRYRE